MSSVIVSFPNPTGLGLKTHTVKTTPSTPLTEVINQVVTKYALGDPLAFGLRHKKALLDSSLSMRFANLAPGTKLELTPIGKASKGLSQITVALQLENGQRLVERFMSSTSFWGILNLFATQHSSAFEKSPIEQTAEDDSWITPVFQLLNQEVFGFAQLNETTLQSLGITSGNILVRLSFRNSQVAYSDICTQIQEACTNNQILPIEAPQPKPKAVREEKTPLVSTSDTEIKPNLQTGVDTIDRGIQVFKVAETDISLSARLDLPDSHFELSSAELKMAVSGQQARTRQLMEGAPLKTKAMVEKEKKRWLDEHPTTTIRVRLPDTTQLQATFRSIEPISALGQVIRSSLHDSRRPFVLSQAPPYRSLDPDSDDSFYSLGLVPSAQIHLRFTDSQADVPILINSLAASAEALPLPPIPTVSSDKTAPVTADDDPKERLPKVESKVDLEPQGKTKLPKWLKLSK
ncbi:hypothetical protein DSO57_1025035 [Entomophthora muscae]|uniref:Uncharacterized protein n=2 Tax=Entomophthora muscae TaxID=34485 RepID=A0ACC2UN93_9FUNG|nr:hypothetical protein DSO57_1025035 [Entomophthora muscae]